MKLNLFLPAALLVAFLGASAARAQSVTFDLTPFTEIGSPGDTLNFSGTLANGTTSTVFLNGDSPSNLPSFLTLDAGPFNNNAPASLDPSASYTGGFFNVTLGPNAAPGTYTGTFEITGGADSNASDIVASADFTVDVLPAAVPEASTTVSMGLLLALGLGAVVVARRRKTLCGID